MSEAGTGQGSVISPLLANVYLHYVFDLWAERWRRREATGDMIFVRYADDIVLGFQHETDARRFWDAMRERLREFSLTLHPEKTRLIKFGRYAAPTARRTRTWQTGDFQLPWLHLHLRQVEAGQVPALRKSRRDRMQAKLKEIKEELRQRRHQSIPEQGKWLRQVVGGFFAYHAVPTNSRALDRVSTSCDRPLAAFAPATQPEGPDHMGTHGAVGRCFSSSTAHPSSLAKRSLCRQTPKVGAECLRSGPLGSVRGAQGNLCPYRDLSGLTASSRMRKEQPMSDEKPMGQVIQIDEARIRDHLGEMVRGTVEETLNAMLDAEADQLCGAGRYERSGARQDTRAGSYERTLQTSAGEVNLKVPKLRRQTFETAIIERYRRRKSSVEEALIEMYLAGISVRRVEDITEALWGTRVSPSTVSNLNKKIYAKIEACEPKHRR